MASFPFINDYPGTLEIDLAPCLSYAMAYAGRSPLLGCTIVNDSYLSWPDMAISLEGDWIAPAKARTGLLAPHSDTDAAPGLQVSVDIDELANVDAPLITDLRATVTSGTDRLMSTKIDLRVLPYFSWPGTQVLPELLASFCRPGQSRVAELLGKASAILAANTGNGEFDEYKTLDPVRAKSQVEAIMQAIQAEGIALQHACPPFSTAGIDVRTADEILAEKTATSLELSLLMASCLEGACLRPMLVLARGRCLPALWLVRDAYAKSVGDDHAFLVRAVNAHEIAVLDPACLDGASSMKFERACANGLALISDARDLELWVDVMRARIDGINPLPERKMAPDGRWIVDAECIDLAKSPLNINAPDRYELIPDDAPEANNSKISLWERKLLDLTLRNNLLNMSLHSRILPLMASNTSLLEDSLQKGDGHQIASYPGFTATDADKKWQIFDPAVFGRRADVIDSAMAHNQILAAVPANHLESTLKNLYRASKTALEENGANNLFMVIGVMKWLENDRSKQPRYAPLLLMPVDMGRPLRGTFTIKPRGEEIMMNVTLLEFLRLNHGIDLSSLTALPHDDSGVNVRKVFAIIRTAIASMPGWDVLDEALLGLFSFSKFVMWNDLHTCAEKMCQHPIISGLVNGELASVDDSATSGADAKAFDSSASPTELAVPIDVDSSQLEAIIDAGAGRSFILHGPPGTGKSQTITNIIANALRNGKRVLFVAEKMAALSVVQSRLQSLGLAPFCLELHSNKATKQHFLQQMQEALDVRRTAVPGQYDAKGADLFAHRKQMIAYIENLHKRPAPTRLSLYECITEYLALECEPLQGVDPQKLSHLTADAAAAVIRDLRTIDTLFSITGQPCTHPLCSLILTDFSVDAEKAVAMAVPAAAAAIKEWLGPVAAVQKRWKISPLQSERFAKWCHGMADFFARTPRFTPALITLASQPNRQKELTECLQAGKAAQRVRERLKQRYTPAIMRVNFINVVAQWDEASDKFFSFFAKRKVVKQLKSSGLPVDSSLMHGLVADMKLFLAKSYTASKAGSLGALFGEDLSQGAKPDWDAMLQMVNDAAVLGSLQKEMAEMYGATQEWAVGVMREAFPADWSSARAEGQELAALGARTSDVLAQVGVIEKHADTAKYSAWGTELLPQLLQWCKGVDGLRDWGRWCKRRHEMLDLGLDAAVAEIERTVVAGYALSCSYAKAYYKALAEEMIDSDPDLRMFHGLLFQDVIDKYRSLTQDFKELSRLEVLSRLSAAIPSGAAGLSDIGEMGYLKRNIRNGGRGQSIRTIIDHIPSLLPLLCPCMLMSPISVAQYISIDAPKFDIVIFDEASQMPTSEAVGTIARGKALIVVGDPKQMPPTSFFTTQHVSEEEVAYDDLESILDDCSSLSMPSKRLSWHYRSRHESLIAFSNSRYYNSRLITFPSVDDQKSKVSLRQINGIYDKGRSCTNEAEARAIAAEVISRLSNPATSAQSIGIVTFSKAQQDLVDDILSDELSKHPQLEKLAYDSEEPIFIKNLENVQGDERDVVLFSIGYGPDKDGKVSLNFGPLNNEGGERRLNVAVSRARCEMIVFASITPDQIDLKRSSKLGVEGLRRFLEFAATGRAPLAIDPDSAPSGNDYITRKIAEALRQRGYDCDLMVGRSRFKVDIAVKDPANPDQYILGILCDGPNYYATKTVRDREVVQPSALARLGWRIMHVWTLDWFKRPDDVIGSIIKALDYAPEVDAAWPVAPAPQAPSPQEAEAESEPEAAPPAASMPLPYVAAQLPVQPYSADASTIERLHLHILQGQIEHVVEEEWPITIGLLCKRVMKAWGQTRVTPKMLALIEGQAKAMRIHMQRAAGSYVCWPKKRDRDTYAAFRVAGGRDISEIPMLEIQNAVLYVIDNAVAMDIDELLRATSAMLGYSRMGTVIETTLRKALGSLAQASKCTIQGVKVKKI